MLRISNDKNQLKKSWNFLTLEVFKISEKSWEAQSCVNFSQKYLSKIMLISLSIIIYFSK